MKFDYGILLWVKNTFIALLFVQISLRHLYYVLFTKVLQLSHPSVQ